MAKPGKIVRLHKGMEEYLAVRWDSRPAERAIQNDVRDYYDLLADALRKIKLDEDELDYLKWLFAYDQVLPQERKALWQAVGRLATNWPYPNNLHPTTFARRLTALSPLENLAISDAMERAIAHQSYRTDIPQMYRAVGLLKPTADDPFPRPPMPTPPYMISTEVLKTSDTWSWPAGYETRLVNVQAIGFTPEELAHVDAVLVDLPHPRDREALLKTDPVLVAICARMEAKYLSMVWWSTVVDMLRLLRDHPEYENDPVAAYRAAGLCR